MRERVKQVCDALAVAWAEPDFSIDEEPSEDLAEAQASGMLEGQKLRKTAEDVKKSLHEIMQHSDVLKLLYPSHDSWDPTMFELRQFTRGASGCRLFEELFIYLGRAGSNRKTTTLKLLSGTFGTASKQGSRGYVCTQKAKYFEQKGSGAASAPDEGIDAMKGARFVALDEFGDGSFSFTVDNADYEFMSALAVWQDLQSNLVFASSFASDLLAAL